jgi:hypothetical protein
MRRPPPARAAAAAIAIGATLLATRLAAAPPVAPPVGTPAPHPAPAAAEPGRAATLGWEELVPAGARAGYKAGPPPPLHDYLSGEDGLAAQQPQDFAVNAALEGRTVRIPGFIVPLELDPDGRVTEFFLVPYFGACIHVPPPPPNQMLYVSLPQGLTLDSMYAAYWVSGRLSTHTQKTKLGAAAYSLAATGVEEYKY